MQNNSLCAQGNINAYREGSNSQTFFPCAGRPVVHRFQKKFSRYFSWCSSCFLITMMSFSQSRILLDSLVKFYIYCPFNHILCLKNCCLICTLRGLIHCRLPLKRLLSPYQYPTAPVGSRIESENQSLSSDAMTEDTMSVTDSALTE